MAYSGNIVDYLGSGLSSARPATPSLTPGALGIYYATDTEVTSVWDGSAWNDLPSGSGGSGITAMNEQTGTSYTLALADATKAVRCTNSGAVTLTIPTNASVALPVLSGIPVFQGGAGAVTISAASGVTLESPNGVVTTAIGDFRTAFQRATNVWVIG